MKKLRRMLFLTGLIGVISSPAFAVPDLIIETISGVKPSYVAGDPMPNFKVYVKNIGSTAIPVANNNTANIIFVSLNECTYNFNGIESDCVHTFRAGAPTSTPFINGITPGEIVALRWPLLWPGIPTNTFQDGEYTLRFKVKTRKYEPSTDNNYHTVNIVVSKAMKTLKVVPKKNLKVVPKAILPK